MAGNTEPHDTDLDDERRPEPSPPAGTTEEELVRGRRAETPFVVLGGVAVTIWLVVALVAAGLLLIWWLG